MVAHLILVQRIEVRALAGKQQALGSPESRKRSEKMIEAMLSLDFWLLPQYTMELFFEGQVQWSQIDANQHLRHSAYADFGAQARINMLSSVGLTFSKLTEAKIGPVIFREELRYLREVRLGDFIKVNCELINARPDGSRWSIRHELVRRDGITAAIIVCEGAWIDTNKRKLARLTPEMIEMFLKTPRSSDFGENPLFTTST